MMTLQEFDKWHQSDDYPKEFWAELRAALAYLADSDREWRNEFAKAALTGIIDRTAGPAASAFVAFEYADAMLSESKRRGGQDGK